MKYCGPEELARIIKTNTINAAAVTRDRSLSKVPNRLSSTPSNTRENTATKGSSRAGHRIWPMSLGPAVNSRMKASSSSGVTNSRSDLCAFRQPMKASAGIANHAMYVIGA
ncbi:hypothetical protein ACQGFI_30950 [Rhodococcus sp. 2.95]